MRSNTQLIYFLSETHFSNKAQSILVVNLVGPLTRENVITFQQCQEQISLSRAKWIVLNFRDVPADFDPEFLSQFDQLRTLLNKKAAVIRFSGIHPDVKKKLMGKQLLSAEEVTNNLAEALQSFPGAS